MSKDVEYETVRRGLFEEKVATENTTVNKEQDVNEVIDQRQVGEWRVQGEYPAPNPHRPKQRPWHRGRIGGRLGTGLLGDEG